MTNENKTMPMGASSLRGLPFFAGGFISALVIKLHFQLREEILERANDLELPTKMHNNFVSGDLAAARQMVDAQLRRESGPLEGWYKSNPALFYASWTSDLQALDHLQDARYLYHLNDVTDSLHGYLSWVPPNETEANLARFTRQFVLQKALAPELSVTRWLGQPSPLGTLKGKVVLLDFWGTWCGPCRRALPKTQALYDEFKDQGLAVVGIHSTAESETAEGFLRKSSYTFPVALDKDNKTAAAYGVTGWPTYIVIGRDGRVFWAPVDLDPIIARLSDEEFAAQVRQHVQAALAQSANAR